MYRKVKIALSNHRAELGKIKEDTKEKEVVLYREFNGTFENYELFPTKILEKIEQGFAYTTQHKDYRHQKNFICGQHVALDLDTEDERSTFEWLLEDKFIKRYATFIHTTPSHTVDKPKARVVFLLDRPIYDKDKYAELAKALVEYYAISDEKCKDPSRFFYGAKGCETKWIGNSLPLEVAAKELIEPARKREEQKRKFEEKLAKNRVVVSNTEVPEELLEKHSNSLLDRVRTAPDGEKHGTLRDISATFGGYVASGYYGKDQVIVWLKNAIRQNPNNVQSYTHADKTIAEGVEYGTYRPLYFEERDGSVQATQKILIPELDTVHPPLTASQKAQVVDIINEREWKLYHKILMEKGIQSGYPGAINEHLMLGFREQFVDEDGVVIPDALTVPYYVNTDVVGIEFIAEDSVTYDGAVGLYNVKPMFNEKSNFGIILPNSLRAIDFYLSGDGSALIFGLPQTEIELSLPDIDLYCAITPDMDMEILEFLNKQGVKFVRFRNLNAVIDGLSRQEFEILATRGKKLEAVI